MKRTSVMMILVAFMMYSAYGQDKEITGLLNDLLSDNWYVVSQAKEKLENMEGESIPGLVSMLQDKTIKKLTHTGDLIYPGAERFFGHGQIIDYDIDRIDVRAGWLLEELTFQNFGFTGVHIQSDYLTDYIRFNFPKFYNNSRNRKLIDDASEMEKRNMIRDLSTSEAEKWWEARDGEWTRLEALIEALKSEDEKRQAKALFYIRNGKTKCTGLNRESYKSEIEKTIVLLSKSPLKRISEQSKLILLDTDFDWLSVKPSSD
ncbi:MAG: hypothetical protein JW723_00195 [Bacteroidales bacterium]|nr:hypothetical protein [Bacteroidales bacterium]